jgi:hypothetical protein
MDKQKKYKVIDCQMNDNPYDKRFIITTEDGEILDDAQGYGYKSAPAAHKAYWYKFQKGKEKIEKNKKELNLFCKKNKKFIKEFNEKMELEFKTSSREEIIRLLEKKHNILVPKKIKKYI